MPDFDAPDGTRLHYDVFDESATRPVRVVLLHGFAADTATNWVRPGVVRALVDAGWPVVGVDARGHGRSGKPHDPAAYAGMTMAEDVVALLDHLRAGGAHLAGYSMGAYTALRVAAVERRVRSLVLAGVGARMRSRATVDRHVIADALVTEDRSAITDPSARAFRFFADATKGDRTALAAAQRADRAPLPDPATITVPTLVLAGEADTLAGPPDQLAAAFPAGRPVVVPGDHVNAPTRPGFAEAIVAFLDELAIGEL